MIRQMIERLEVMIFAHERIGQFPPVVASLKMNKRLLSSLQSRQPSVRSSVSDWLGSP